METEGHTTVVSHDEQALPLMAGGLRFSTQAVSINRATGRANAVSNFDARTAETPPLG
jgi:hypothetical protein